MIRIALLLAAVLAAGCAYDQSKSPALADQSPGVERALDAILDPMCEIKQEDLKDEPQTRLLRAHLLIGIIARYGVARTEDYSDDRPGDAGRIMTRTEITLRSLERALKKSTTDGKMPWPMKATTPTSRIQHLHSKKS
jgi:hypothetical protein